MDRVAPGSEASDSERFRGGASAPGRRCQTCGSHRSLAAQGDAADATGASGHCTIAAQGDAAHTIVSCTGGRTTCHRAALQLSRSDLRLPGSALTSSARYPIREKGAIPCVIVPALHEQR